MVNKNNFYALILAGGAGSRLWPLSREMCPKQLLKINEDKTLFQSTFLRLTDCFESKNIFTVTNIKQENHVKAQLSQMNSSCISNVLVEPLSRNSAPAISLGAIYLTKEKDKDAIIAAIPSDHLIKNTQEFSKSLNKAYEIAKQGYIATFGIKPTSADTGFGYIKATKEIDENALKVEKFAEKPCKEQAQKMLEDNYFWNSGIFVFKASVFIQEIKKYSPDIFKILDNTDIFLESPSVSFDDFEKLEDISIDYSLMEKSDKLVLIPFDCDWKDLGSWESIYEISPKDSKNNYIQGKVIDIDSENSMIYSTSKLVSTIGLKNIILVETEDAILACDKSRVQDVKEIYKELKSKNDETYLVHRTVYRPWGFYTVLNEGEGFLTKVITVNPGAKLSLQKHFHRSEHWVVLEGTALVVKGEKEHILDAGHSIDIAVEEVHSLQNPHSKPVKILEVQKGDYISEDDIVRITDIYGRA